MNITRLTHRKPPCFVIAVLVLLRVTLAFNLVHAGEAETVAQPADKTNSRVLVAYYSRTGNTEKMAQGVADGVRRVPGVVPVVKQVSAVSKDDLEAADGLILGCPTYYANIPGEMKLILDDWNWKWKVNFTDKAGGAFATAGGELGGQGHVVVSLLLFMLNNRMVVAGPLYLDETTGSYWGEAGAAAVTASRDPGISAGELDGARRLGERVARLAAKLKSSTLVLRAPAQNQQ